MDDVTVAYDDEVATWLERYPMPVLEAPELEGDHGRSAWREYLIAAGARDASPRDLVNVDDVAARSEADGAEVPLRIYRPAAGHRPRALLYAHSGAFCIGDLDTEDEKCRRLALDAGCVVVSVGYRLAPEHPHPIPLDDCYSAWRWLVDTAADLSVDEHRLGVGGISAGGALAASVAQIALDRGDRQPALQLLLCPVLDTSLESPSMDLLEDRTHLAQMWERYLGGPLTGAVPGYAVPARRASLAGLAPAYIVAAELDGLRDQAVEYAHALWRAGVRAELHVWPGVPHAFDLFAPEAAIARKCQREQAETIVRFLA